eukprot:CAMPEP_0185836824 /NCGR_PEP_ID=MMETSP1353-20130828/10371_1 /TAXON_ID=1077150 /ORGANISM="Erythrolobus australicus, Strain CCMP3124" /LENGTH=43 /DNA_ID= /DNA_START= /DNA_END= /DNA_ORIENTATION=
MVHSWLELAAVLPFEFVCCCPPDYKPSAAMLARATDAGLSTVS